MMELRAKQACAWAVPAVLGAAMIVWSLGPGPASGQEDARRGLDRQREALAAVQAARRGPDSLIARLREKGAVVSPLARRGALDGWWVEAPGQAPYALYFDGTGHAVMGVLYGPGGEGVTKQQLEELRAGAAGPGSRATKAGRSGRVAAAAAPAGVLEAALAVEGFDLGESGPQVAVFADPNCLPGGRREPGAACAAG